MFFIKQFLKTLYFLIKNTLFNVFILEVNVFYIHVAERMPIRPLISYTKSNAVPISVKD